MSNASKTNILFLASEADPLIKVGGLGDVAGSLPRALQASGSKPGIYPPGVDVRLVIPFHPGIHVDKSTLNLVAEYSVHSRVAAINARVFETSLDGLPVYLVDGAPIREGDGVYSTNLVADGYRYVFFSLAALDLPKQLGWKLDILHANDWHTAASVYSLALNRPMDPFYRRTASVLTVHNLPYLGAMTSSALEAFDLPPAQNTSLPSWAAHMALPLGLLTTDSIVAVSPGYAKEIMTPSFGVGLHTFLRAHAEKISGILNGLDTLHWDPSTDSALAARFSASSIHDRPANKSFLQHELDLEETPTTPLLAMVTRMDPQKGIDLAVDAMRSLFQSPAKGDPPFQVVFLGTGNPALEQAAAHLEQDFPSQVRTRITYSEKLSRHIYAGADMLLMPSRYEPCGLSQMIAMRYGCIPVAHATGGLSDTISDASESDIGTGFLFKPAASGALVDTLRRALQMYIQAPQPWLAMQIRAMQEDFSWDQSAAQYLALYQKLLEHRNETKLYV